MSGRAAILAGCVATAISSGCRESEGYKYPAAPTADDPVVAQLTFSTGREQNPVWSHDGDTVYYSATAFIDSANLPGPLLGVPRIGGVAHLLLPEAQLRATERLTIPAISPDGRRVAYVQLARVLLGAACVGVTSPACAVDEPLLDSAVIRVREMADAGKTELAHYAFRFPGSDAARAAGSTGPFTQILYPFQQQFNEESSLVFRASWAPDGQRLVFSDGQRLMVWTVGGTVMPIPNTLNGVSPAWSPDGSAIAFTRYIHGDSTVVACTCIASEASGGKTEGERYNRKLFQVIRRALTVIKPDGSEATEVTTGEDPAWSPDGQTLYFRADPDLYRIPRTGGAPVKLASTFNGRSPAVSPNGRWLAFSRTPDINNPDLSIWIIRLTP